MIDNIDDFQRVTRLSAAFHRAQVVHDLNNDMAGREVGRIQRVRHGDVGLAIEDRKRRERLEQLVFETALAALLADPVYRARHEKFGKFLDRYEAAAKTALQRAIEASHAAHAAVQEALDNANTLYGKPVFVTDDGRIVDRDGAEIDAAAADDIIWRDGAVSYSELLALNAGAEKADAAIESIRSFKADLGAARAKLDSPDDPYESVEELVADEARLKADTPKLVAERLTAGTLPPPSPDDGIATAGKLTLPK